MKKAMKELCLAICVAGGLAALGATAIVSPTQGDTTEAVPVMGTATIDLSYADYDWDTMMGLACWERRGLAMEWSCKADGPPPLPEYCQVYITYTCGCKEVYETVCRDEFPMTIKDSGGFLYITNYDNMTPYENCGGKTIGDVMLLSDGTTLPAEACPRYIPLEILTGVTLLSDGTTVPNDVVVDDAWRTYDCDAYTMEKGGDCWELDGDTWKCDDSEGNCWVKFTHDWLGSTTTFYATCKEDKPMRLRIEVDGDWCISDEDRMVFKLKKDQSMCPVFDPLNHKKYDPADWFIESVTGECFREIVFVNLTTKICDAAPTGECSVAIKRKGPKGLRYVYSADCSEENPMRLTTFNYPSGEIWLITVSNWDTVWIK